MAGMDTTDVTKGPMPGSSSDYYWTKPTAECALMVCGNE